MKLPKDLEELMSGIKWNRIIPPMVSVLQPVIIFGAWLAFSKFDKRASALSKLIAMAEPIPAIDLSLPKPVVLASLFHATETALTVLEDVIEFLEDIEIPSSKEIVEEIKEVIIPDPITPKEGIEIISDYNDCVNGYKRDTPKLLQNNTTKALYVNTCLLRKGWGTEAVQQAIRDFLT